MTRNTRVQPSDEIKKYDALGQLLGCYLHQDWGDEFRSDAATLQAIIESEPKERITAGIAEIDTLLAAALPESELRAFLVDEIGCYFDPGSEELTYEQWLDRVRSAFTKA